MNLEYLRTATRPEHEATESAMPLIAPGLTLEEYAGVLQRLHVLISSWEQWAEANAPVDLLEMVINRQRRALLEQDILLLGAAPGKETMKFQEFRIPGLQANDQIFRASFLGAMYVVEGSTLGGQHIARHVEKVLNIKAGKGNAYFRGYGDRTGMMWQEFKAVLTDVPEDQSDHVIAAAKAMFRVFGDGMQLQVG